MATKNQTTKSAFQSDEDENRKLFPRLLLKWHHSENGREMPWKGEKDPYKIWLSEIILQQTRVEQGLKYYQNFITAFPNVTALAAAPDESVMKIWEGLGYYSRCRNLLHTAREIVKEYKGTFPTRYSDIINLKGVGPYTAAAIASFAYNAPHAVLDGNVFRVLSRIFNASIPIDSTVGKKYFTALAQDILPENKAALYNQAIMDFGAVVCKPVPQCASCFFNKHCLAFKNGQQDALPVKEKKTVLKERWLNYFVVQHNKQVLVKQRTSRDIWQNLYEFLLLETKEETKSNQLLPLLNDQYGLHAFKILDQWSTEQRLSHRLVYFRFIQVALDAKQTVPLHQWVSRSTLQKLPFPKALQQVLQSRLH